MSGVHVHLLVNHAPIFGAFFALALLVASLFVAAEPLRRTALVVLVGVGLAAGAAQLSGEPAEEAVENVAGVGESAIHEHEEFAEAALITAGVVAVFALLALGRWRRSPLPRLTVGLALVGALAVSGMMARTGLLGGRIRHTEVRPGVTAATADHDDDRNEEPR